MMTPNPDPSAAGRPAPRPTRRRRAPGTRTTPEADFGGWRAAVAATPPVDAVTAAARAASFTRRSLKTDTKRRGLRMAVSMIDLTTLEGADTPGRVAHLCRKAVAPMDPRFACPPCAAVCVYPNLVAEARRLVAGTGVLVASVATAFPSGQFPRSLKLDDVRFAVGEGADEIDMVIDRGAFLRGDLAFVFDEIAEVKAACGRAHLKVILETGELRTLDNVRLASELAMRAGADFIKTSTGKVTPAATLPVTLVMLEAVRDFHAATGRPIGMKAAGGIRRAKEALHYLAMVRETLGEAWLTPDRFRFGASSLLGDLELQIARMDDPDGRYPGPDYFPLG